MEFPSWLSGQQTQLASMRTRVQSLASLSGLRIRDCHELWCRLQTCLRSCIAVTLMQAGGNSSNWTPSLGTSIGHGYSPKKTKRPKKKKNVNSYGCEDSLYAYQVSCMHKCQFVVLGIYKYKSCLLIMSLMKTINATQHQKSKAQCFHQCQSIPCASSVKYIQPSLPTIENSLDSVVTGPT